MESNNEMMERIEKALGRPAATMLAPREAGDRHFILEVLFTTAAVYIGAKFLDGFIDGFIEGVADGVGVSTLGKSLGQRVKRVVTFSHDALEEPKPVSAETLQAQIDELSQVAAELRSYTFDRRAQECGIIRVREELEQRGLPAIEAQKIAVRIGGALWPESP